MRQINEEIRKKANENKCQMVIDVVEVAKGVDKLENAVKYFIGNKVVTKDFDSAAELQKQGIKDIVTEKGVQFKAGMISGGVNKSVTSELKMGFSA